MTEESDRAKMVMDRITAMATCSDDPAGISRVFGSAAFKKAGKLIKDWMEEAGLQTRTDNIGNVRGRYLSDNPLAKTFVIGSHFDSVINAGKFDGPLGIVLSIDIGAKLIKQKQALPFHLECVAFSDEEGVRFHTAYLGSKVLCGTLEESILNKPDAEGITVKQVITDIGGNAEDLFNDRIHPDQWLGYFELHIEQGPVLYEKDVSIAVVTGIAAQKRIQLSFEGEPGHAGTVPMNMRSDALCAAAQCVLAVETLANKYPYKLVATIGKLEIPNSASNVIPGKVICTLDIRSIDATLLSDTTGAIQKFCDDICKERKICMEWKVVQETDPIDCDPLLIELLEESIQENQFPLIKLTSGAGHDAVAISALAPVSMLFIQCYKGISHNPKENVEIKDIAAAIKVSDTFFAKLIAKYSNK